MVETNLVLGFKVFVQDWKEDSWGNRKHGQEKYERTVGTEEEAKEWMRRLHATFKDWRSGESYGSRARYERE